MFDFSGLINKKIKIVFGELKGKKCKIVGYSIDESGTLKVYFVLHRKQGVYEIPVNIIEVLR